MIEKPKLVICDIDWTLLSRQKRDLDAYTLGVFEKMHRDGVMFGVASGRPIKEVQRVYDSWGLSFPCDVILEMNGGELWDEKNRKFSEYFKLKKEWVREIVENTMQFSPEVNPYMYYHDSIKAMKESEVIEGTAIRNNYPLVIAKDVDDFAAEDNGKIMIRLFERMDEFAKYLDEHPSANYHHFLTQETLMEFADSRISKGHALEQYCKAANVSLDTVMAFGDTTNDNDMIAAAGWGV